MNGSTLQTFAAECAEELPAAQLEHPFGPDWEVFKVRRAARRPAHLRHQHAGGPVSAAGDRLQDAAR